MAGFDSLYIGKVIRDSDLLEAEDDRPYNRVRVLIIGQSSIENENFQQPLGSNNPNVISKQLLDVVDKEVYAYVMQPVAGSGTGAVYNAQKDLISVSDMGNIEDLNARPPADYYHNVTDSYVGGPSSAGVNPTAHAYSPDNRSNSYKGMLSLPGVGATVVVSFLNGSRGMPIIVGVLPTAADVDSLHDVGNGIYPNYPFAYSNLTGPSETVENVPTEEAPATVSGGPVSSELVADDELTSEELRNETVELIRQERGDAAAAAAGAELDRISAEQAADRKAMWKSAADAGGYIPPHIKSEYGL